MSNKAKIVKAINALAHTDQYLGQFVSYEDAALAAMTRVKADPANLGMRYRFETTTEAGMVVAGKHGYLVILDTPNYFLSPSYSKTSISYHRFHGVAVDQIAYDLFIEGMPMIAMVELFDRFAADNPVDLAVVDRWLHDVEQGLLALKFLPTAVVSTGSVPNYVIRDPAGNTMKGWAHNKDFTAAVRQLAYTGKLDSGRLMEDSAVQFIGSVSMIPLDTVIKQSYRTQPATYGSIFNQLDAVRADILNNCK